MSEFKRIPLSVHDIRINEKGIVKSFQEGIPDPKISKDDSGYYVFYVRLTDGRRTSPSIHRTIGLLFIDIPDRLKGIPIKDLQINHKDGIKENNDISNLEWVTKFENGLHARENELFSNYIPILVKCEETGEITRYRSSNLAAIAHGVKSMDISHHIKMEYAGALVVNGYRFKADDGKPWSTKKIHPNARQGLRLTYRTTGFDNLTKQEWLFTSIPDACQALGLNLNIVKYIHTKTGVYSSPDGRWTLDVKKLPSIAAPRESIISLNRATGEVCVYDSVRITTKKTGIPGLILKSHIDSPLAGMVPWNGLYYMRNNGTEFPDVEYLFPALNHMGKTIKHVVFKEGDETPYLLARISDICQAYKWDDSCYYDHRKKHGMGVPFRGFRIYNIEDVDLGNRGKYV